MTGQYLKHLKELDLFYIRNNPNKRRTVMGKGSRSRPRNVPLKEYLNNYDAIFAKKDKPKEEKKEKKSDNNKSST